MSFFERYHHFPDMTEIGRTSTKQVDSQLFEAICTSLSCCYADEHLALGFVLGRVDCLDIFV